MGHSLRRRALMVSLRPLGTLVASTRSCALASKREFRARLPVRGRPSGQALRNIGTSDRREGPELRRGCKTFWLRTDPCRALGADPPRDAELRGDLACRRLGSKRKYMKRIYARDTGKAGRQFAR